MPYPDAISGALRGGVAPDEGRLVYALRGGIDIGATSALHSRIAALADSTEGDVVIDLGEVDFIDSSGLFTLIVLRDIVKASDRRFLLRRLQPEVHRTLDLAGMADYFAIEEN